MVFRLDHIGLSLKKRTMKKPFPILLLCLGFALVSGCATASRTGQTALTFSTKKSARVEVGYQLHLPSGYDPDSEKLWPTILFLHGAGERGEDIEKVTVHGPPMIAKADPSFPFIVISPQCPAGENWRADVLLALLDHVSARHAVDEKRIYLTGLSMGGYGSWKLAALTPGRFAAVAPICGGGSTIDIRLARRAKDHPLKSLPFWAFHGGKDTVVPVGESERMIGALKEIGNERAKLTVYPEAGHNSWKESYDNPKLYEWFLSHSR